MTEQKKSKMSERMNGLKGEFHKIVWADSKNVSKQTTAVIVASVVVALIIIAVDAVINYGVEFLVNL